MLGNTIRRYFATDKIILLLVLVVLVLSFNESLESRRYIAGDIFAPASEQSGAYFSASSNTGLESRTDSRSDTTLLYHDGVHSNPVQTTKEIVSLEQTYTILTVLSGSSRAAVFSCLVSILLVLLLLELQDLCCIRRFTMIETSSDLDGLIYYIHHMNGLRR